MQSLVEELENLKFMASAKIKITEDDLGPEPEELRKIKFIKCMEQYHDPNVHSIYYLSRTKGLGVPKYRPGKK